MDMQFTRHQQRIVDSGQATTPGVHLVEASAGSGKSTVLTATAVAAAESERCSLFISLTNSVRHELRGLVQRHLAATGLGLDEEEDAHHIRFSLAGRVLIHIATLDSWVHASLVELGYTSRVEDPGVLVCDSRGEEGAGVPLHAQDYTGKRLRLAAHLESGCSLPQCLDRYDLFFLDETQDLDAAFLRLAQEIGARFSREGAKQAYFAGDPKQQIFGDPGRRPFAELRASFRGLPEFRDHALHVCFRCPPAHLRFVNRVFRGWEPTRWPKGKAEGERPVLQVLRRDTSLAMQAAQVAEEIYHALTAGYSIEDVVFVAPFTRQYGIYCHLEKILSDKYCTGGRERLAWLYTDQQHAADWGRAQGRVTLSSVHANKGRTHKVVVVLGLVDGCLPARGVDLGGLDSCLLYVALTRSCERLVLIAEDDPRTLSYFLRSAFDRGSALAGLCDLRSPHVASWEWTAELPSDTVVRPREQPSSVAAPNVYAVAPWWSAAPRRADGWQTLQEQPKTWDATPSILNVRNLRDVPCPFGRLWFRRELRLLSHMPTLELVLPATLVPFWEAIATSSRAAAKVCAAARQSLEACDSPDEATVLSILLRPAAALSQSLSAPVVIEELQRLAGPLARQPRALVVHAPRGLQRHGVMRLVIPALRDYVSGRSTEELPEATLWSLALAASGKLVLGSFSRPWVTSQLQRCHLSPGNSSVLQRIVQLAARQLAGRVVACDRVFRLGDSTQGSVVVDLVLDDGRFLLDVVLTPEASGLVDPAVWVKLLRCAGSDSTVTRVGVLDLSTGELVCMEVTADHTLRFAHEAQRLEAAASTNP